MKWLGYFEGLYNGILKSTIFFVGGEFRNIFEQLGRAFLGGIMEEIFKADWLSRGGNKWLHFNYLWSISSDFISWSTLHISAYNFKRILKFSYTPNFFLTLTFNWQTKFESPICHISSTVLNFSRGFRFINFDFLRCFFSSLSSSPLHPTVLLLIEMKFRKRFREEIFFFFSFFFYIFKTAFKGYRYYVRLPD